MPGQRDENFEMIRRNGAFDVIVIGGGINGIGVYRELALQGLRVLLVERNDFCSACSAAPSRMIHGGLRYLENGEFDLVKESLRERDALLTNAPHMVRPLPTTIPINGLFSGLLNGAASFVGVSTKPSSRGALPVKIGLALYDWTTRVRRLLPKHAFRGREETLRLWPDLSPSLRFSATYYDAWISHPERLAIELIMDTKAAAPDCVALNYTELTAQRGRFSVHDHLEGERIELTARAIVNATGAWLDDTLASLRGGSSGGENFVSGTKGSHLILDCPDLYAALGGHMIFFENTDGRVCIVFPYLGKVLAGSTDIRVKSAGRVRCEPEERDYILKALRVAFPRIVVSERNVVFSYSGIRPLPRSDHKFTGRISRGHYVHRVEDPIPQFCMVGGKWTTFRAFAEQTADAVLAELGHARVAGTLELAIGGGADFPQDPIQLEAQLAAAYRITADRAAHLIDLYGTGAHKVLQFCTARADDTPVMPGSQTTMAEIAYLALNEHACRLGDIFLRRTAIAITGEITQGHIEKVAELLAAALGWTDARKRQEIAYFIDELTSYYGVSLSSGAET
ncbi:glycerol-3-phosphate dehydrogenase/oxidase [Pelagibacterium limicola]|uniref:glycerol-3-phosphate dehydrogenase/oxidase n=1 Tax=Pelagibacterium limicola TaxID=2791022 RepID=UPI0018AFC9A9|nr:glycerol-3-phosphate dehydrogenase/oxidase [Pelagibacterium limicola]